MLAEESRKDFFLLHLGYQLRLEPSVQGIGEDSCCRQLQPTALAFVVLAGAVIAATQKRLQPFCSFLPMIFHLLIYGGAGARR